MKKRIILDLCGGTGAWSDPWKKAGYKVILITLPEHDIFDTVFMVNDTIFFGSTSGKNAIEVKIKNIYGILAAPPCTKFSKAAWQIKKKDRDFKEGMRCVRACMEIIWKVQERSGANLKFWALENPMGYLYNFLGRPVFYFQPWQFGQKGFTATKRTAIWGYFNPPAKTTRTRTMAFISPRSSKRDKVDKKRENNGWYKANAEERAITDPGFAKAFYQANK